jgi:hypothetical protein
MARKEEEEGTRQERGNWDNNRDGWTGVDIERGSSRNRERLLGQGETER